MYNYIVVSYYLIRRKANPLIGLCQVSEFTKSANKQAPSLYKSGFGHQSS